MWRIVWLIRDFGETRKYTRRLEEEIIPKQLVDLVRQAQAGQSFETEWNISVGADMREKLCWPLTPEQVEIIRATPHDQCQEKRLTCYLKSFADDGKKLSGVVLSTIRFRDDSKGIDLDYRSVPLRLVVTRRLDKRPVLSSVERAAPEEVCVEKVYKAHVSDIVKVAVGSLAAGLVIGGAVFGLNAGGRFLLTLLISCLPPWGSVWWGLSISNHQIRKRALFGLCDVRIDYEKAGVGSYASLGRYYKVFSEMKLAGLDRRSVRRLIRRRKAFIFPWNAQMKHDFPELFEREQKIRPPQ